MRDEERGEKLGGERVLLIFFFTSLTRKYTRVVSCQSFSIRSANKLTGSYERSTRKKTWVLGFQYVALPLEFGEA